MLRCNQTHIVPLESSHVEYPQGRIGQVRAQGYFAIGREEQGQASERQNKLKSFFAFQMLRLSGVAAQQCPRTSGHTSDCADTPEHPGLPLQEFCQILRGGGSKIVIYESPVLAQKGGTQAYPPFTLLISQTAERKMLFQSEDFTCFMNMKMKVNEKSRADLLLYQILLIVSHG